MGGDAPQGARGLSARTLVSQHGVPKPGLWKGFSGAPTAVFAAVGYLGSEAPHHQDPEERGDQDGEVVGAWSHLEAGHQPRHPLIIP